MAISARAPPGPEGGEGMVAGGVDEVDEVVFALVRVCQADVAGEHSHLAFLLKPLCEYFFEKIQF
jgi:hypothetical protein